MVIIVELTSILYFSFFYILYLHYIYRNKQISFIYYFLSVTTKPILLKVSHLSIFCLLRSMFDAAECERNKKRKLLIRNHSLNRYLNRNNNSFLSLIFYAITNKQKTMLRSVQSISFNLFPFSIIVFLKISH